MFGCPSLLLFHGVDADLFAVFAHALESDGTVDQGEEGVVRTFADVVAGVDVRAALSDEDVASQDELSVCALDGKAYFMSASMSD